MYVSYFSDRLKESLEAKSLTPYKVTTEAMIGGSLLYKVLNDERKPTDEFIEKLASYKPLGLTPNEMKAWKILDEYDKETILASIKHVDKLRKVKR